ncbi:hypothetical protein [Azoarcus sp. DN11]|uniref:hypothetical protein n=1 Tax=Azoarcus sp. DN11 TaxID=356837 RepID=UPI000FE23FE3|nr:hypothetical protein [Azoarcus sp. DN11]
MFAALIRRVVPVREGETLPLLLATAYGFAILYAYYLLRPVRDEIGAADRGNLQILWTAVFLVMLLAVPLYSVAVARWPRAVFVPLANRFFAANLGAFYAALHLLPAVALVGFVARGRARRLRRPRRGTGAGCVGRRARALRQQPPCVGEARARGAVHAGEPRGALQGQGLH